MEPQEWESKYPAQAGHKTQEQPQYINKTCNSCRAIDLTLTQNAIADAHV
jgi:hypothetical protein